MSGIDIAIIVLSVLFLALVLFDDPCDRNHDVPPPPRR